MCLDPNPHNHTYGAPPSSRTHEGRQPWLPPLPPAKRPTPAIPPAVPPTAISTTPPSRCRRPSSYAQPQSTTHDVRSINAHGRPTHHFRAIVAPIQAIHHDGDDEHIPDPPRPQADAPSHHSFFPHTSAFVAVTGEAMIIGSKPSTLLPSPARPYCTACAAVATAGAPSCHRLVHPSLQPNECNAHHLSRLRRSANHAWAAIIESRPSIRGSCCRTARSCPLPPSNDNHSTAIKRTSRMHVATPTTHAIADAARSARLRRSRPRECTMQLPSPARRQHWQLRRRPPFCFKGSRKSYSARSYSAHSDFL
ncbi:hypothetical protein ACLOJK_037661 [Asimina triloba]